MVNEEKMHMGGAPIVGGFFNEMAQMRICRHPHDYSVVYVVRRLACDIRLFVLS